MSTYIEHIMHHGRLFAIIIRAKFLPEKTMFPTDPAANLQLGFIKYSAGSTIPRHFHKMLKRTIVGTAEILLVKQGLCEVHLFTRDQEPVTTKKLARNDIIILMDGGHGFTLLEDTVLLEIKQGPYFTQDEKVLF